MFDDSPRCYICFEGEDESGKPLRRDCSCRGSDGGFAHLHCLVKFAEQRTKSKRSTLKAWALCSCCNSAFENELAVDMDEAFGSYVDSLSGAEDSEHIKALREAIAAEDLPPPTHNRDTILKFDWLKAVGECLLLLLVDQVLD